MITSDILQSKSLFILLKKIDVEFAESKRAQRCPHCGGPLYSAPYQRKPRGGPPDLEESFAQRLSLCCGAEGCRKRLLPQSVLFSGRRVYWGAVILVAVVLRQGRDRGYTVEKLKRLFGVTRPTLRRWIHYFRQIFPETPTWKRLSGRLLPPVSGEELPGSLLARFIQPGGDVSLGLASCLQALACGV
jgi:hypothetical protein